jgi:hypothetical protein
VSYWPPISCARVNDSATNFSLMSPTRRTTVCAMIALASLDSLTII